MFGLGVPEVMVVLVLALLVFGPAKLPEMMASVGHAIREFQRASRELTEVFQETQQEFQSALDLDAQHQTQPATYEVPAEEAVADEPPPVTAQPEEFETAAAMVDPVEPFQAPVQPEPEPEPVAAVAGPSKPKRSRRKKAVEPVAEAVDGDDAVAGRPVAEELAAEPLAAAAAVAELAMAPEPVGAEPAAAEPAAEPPAAEPAVAEVTTTVTQGVSASTPVEEPAPNGAAPHPNGAAPKTRRRRATVAAASAPGDESA